MPSILDKIRDFLEQQDQPAQTAGLPVIGGVDRNTIPGLPIIGAPPVKPPPPAITSLERNLPAITMPEQPTGYGKAMDLPVIGREPAPAMPVAVKPELPIIGGESAPAVPAPVQRELPAITPGASTPAPVKPELPVIGPPLSPVDAAAEEVRRLSLEKPKDNDKSFWKKAGAVAREGLIGAGKIASQNAAQGRVASPWALLGGAGGGALGYGINPEIDEARTLEARRAEALKNFEITSEIAEKKAKRTYTEAATQNFKDDNDREELKRQDAAAKIANDLKERKRTNFYRQNKYFDPAKATPAQRKQLAEFDETPESIGKFDFTKQEFKQIGQDTFRWDNNEKAFVDTNLPDDKTKMFTEITVKDPETKQSYTFVTTQEKAAGLMNARTVAGLQIEAARDRQVSSQTHDREMKLLGNQLEKAMTAYKDDLAKAREERDETRRQAAEQRAQERLIEIKQLESELRGKVKNSTPDF